MPCLERLTLSLSEFFIPRTTRHEPTHNPDPPNHVAVRYLRHSLNAANAYSPLQSFIIPPILHQLTHAHPWTSSPSRTFPARFSSLFRGKPRKILSHAAHRHSCDKHKPLRAVNCRCQEGLISTSSLGTALGALTHLPKARESAPHSQRFQYVKNTVFSST